MSTGPRNKRRGYELESELVKAAQAEGLSSQRAFGSNGRALGLSADVDLTIAGRAVQAKRRKQLPEYLQIPESCHSVAFRQDRGDVMVLIRFKDYLQWLKTSSISQTL